MKQSALITGVTGFLGGHLARTLLENGHEVVGLVHDEKSSFYVQLEKLCASMHLCRGDIRDLARLREILAAYRITHIYHCAALSTLQKCDPDPYGCFQTNVMGAVTLLEAARLYGGAKGILCMESDKSYGAYDAADLPYREDQILKPKGIYDTSKACVGLAARAYFANFRLPVYTVRTCNIYGPGDMNATRLIVGSVLRALRNESPVIFQGVANYIREFIHVEDAARIIVGLMDEIESTQGKAYNVGSGHVYKVWEVVAEICRIVGDVKPQIAEKNTALYEIEEQCLDLSRMNSVLHPSVTRSRDIIAGLPPTIEWYRAHFFSDRR